MSNGYYRPSGFGGFSFFPPVIKNLLIANGVIFLIQMLLDNRNVGGLPGQYIIMQYFALMPLDSGYFQIWQLVSYQFLHGSFSHILFNMFALWMFGIEIENYWGSKKFALFYILCGVGGGIAQLLLSPVFSHTPAPTIGASGAIYGVMIAFGLLFPDRYIYLNFFIPVKAKYLIGFYIITNVLLIGQGGGVAYLAHIGGALSGLIYMLLDKDIKYSIRNIFRSGSSRSQFFNNSSTGHRNEGYYTPQPKREEPKVEDANYYDVKDSDVITQEEIDRILDKISQSGYKNLTEREKRILFEASKRMK